MYASVHFFLPHFSWFPALINIFSENVNLKIKHSKLESFYKCVTTLISNQVSILNPFFLLFSSQIVVIFAYTHISHTKCNYYYRPRIIEICDKNCSYCFIKSEHNFPDTHPLNKQKDNRIHNWKLVSKCSEFSVHLLFWDAVKRQEWKENGSGQVTHVSRTK